MQSIDDHVAAERIIIAYNQGALPEGDCKCLLDQIRLAGAAAEREWLLALAQQWTVRTCAADGQPCEHQRVAQELISRIRQRGEEGE